MSERYQVTEAFNTPLRRFQKGDELAAADLDGPLGAEDWRRLGKLAPLPEPAEPAPADESPPAATRARR